VCDEDDDDPECDEEPGLAAIRADDSDYDGLEPWANPGLPRLLKADLTRKMVLQWYSRMYPSGRKVFKGMGADTTALNGGFKMASAVCSATSAAFNKFADLPERGFHTEHYHEVSTSSNP
jgi:hypothetical protein